jgi:hypothetical protein
MELLPEIHQSGGCWRAMNPSFAIRAGGRPELHKTILSWLVQFALLMLCKCWCASHGSGALDQFGSAR